MHGWAATCVLAKPQSVVIEKLILALYLNLRLKAIMLRVEAKSQIWTVLERKAAPPIYQ